MVLPIDDPASETESKQLLERFGGPSRFRQLAFSLIQTVLPLRAVTDKFHPRCLGSVISLARAFIPHILAGLLIINRNRPNENETELIDGQGQHFDYHASNDQRSNS